jgi:hypothetical protein
MAPNSFRRHRFPPSIIEHAVWLYLRFTLSYRDVEDLLAERGVEVSCETVRRWVLKFGPAFAEGLRRRRPRPGSRWHLGEMVSHPRVYINMRRGGHDPLSLLRDAVPLRSSIGTARCRPAGQHLC